MIRTTIAAVLLVLLLPAIVIANASNWAARTVVDDATFASTVSRVMDTPSLRDALSQRVSDEVTSYLAKNPETFRLLTTEILHVSGAATMDDVRTALRARLAVALDDPTVKQARDEAVAALHAYLIGAATGTTDQAVRIQGDELVLDTGPLVEKLAGALDQRLTPGTVRLPESDRLVVLASARALETTSDALSLIEVVQFLIPVVAAVVALAVIGLAHRRVRALGLVGIAITIAGAVTLIAAWFGGRTVSEASTDFTVRAITTDVYAAFVTLLVWQAVALVVAGFVITMVAWLLLRRRRGGGISPSASVSPA